MRCVSSSFSRWSRSTLATVSLRVSRDHRQAGRSRGDCVHDRRGADHCRQRRCDSGLFDLRPDEVNRLAMTTVAPPEWDGSRPSTWRSPSSAARQCRPVPARAVVGWADNQGAWQVRVRHRDGSLEAIVARSRRRNLAISLGVLGLLRREFCPGGRASRRQQRLAQQQMEFVASISHELRTPLAVICSAGENLADGVVADAEQVKKYGSLIESEGRRLGDMVERVHGVCGHQLRARTCGCGPDVDPSRAVARRGRARDSAPKRASATSASRCIPTVTLPPIAADADALRSAVQNVVGNAIKYSPAGSHRGRSRRARRRCGPDPGCRSRAWHRRGRSSACVQAVLSRPPRASDAQMRGSGIGLSVVRHVLDSHHGRDRGRQPRRRGTTVTLVCRTRQRAGCPAR